MPRTQNHYDEAETTNQITFRLCPMDALLGPDLRTLLLRALT